MGLLEGFRNKALLAPVEAEKFGNEKRKALVEKIKLLNRVKELC